MWIGRYYEGGVSSVYFWDVDDGFAGVVLLKKCECGFFPSDCLWKHVVNTGAECAAVSPQSKSDGAWDSIHVFEALDRGRTTHYKLTSTVILQLSTAAESLGSMSLSGNLTRQVEVDMPVDDDNSHVANVGKVTASMFLRGRQWELMPKT